MSGIIPERKYKEEKSGKTHPAAVKNQWVYMELHCQPLYA